MSYDTYSIKCSVAASSMFMQELQKGFYISAHNGVTVLSFLTENCGFKNDYITEKIKTVLLDGGPVDDIYNTKIKDRSVCAVSGAMPGIVGAMMRMGSPYAPMRNSITVKPDSSGETEDEIVVELKLFNTILSDRGPCFLKKGILLHRERIINLIKKHGVDILSECREVLFNDSPCERNMTDYGESKGLTEFVVLKVEIEDENNS